MGTIITLANRVARQGKEINPHPLLETAPSVCHVIVSVLSKGYGIQYCYLTCVGRLGSGH